MMNEDLEAVRQVRVAGAENQSVSYELSSVDFDRASITH